MEAVASWAEGTYAAPAPKPEPAARPRTQQIDWSRFKCTDRCPRSCGATLQVVTDGAFEAKRGRPFSPARLSAADAHGARALRGVPRVRILSGARAIPRDASVTAFGRTSVSTTPTPAEKQHHDHRHLRRRRPRRPRPRRPRSAPAAPPRRSPRSPRRTGATRSIGSRPVGRPSPRSRRTRAPPSGRGRRRRRPPPRRRPRPPRRPRPRPNRGCSDPPVLCELCGGPCVALPDHWPQRQQTARRPTLPVIVIEFADDDLDRSDDLDSEVW